MKHRPGILLAIILLVCPGYGFELCTDPNTGRRSELSVVGKWTTLASYAPDDPQLYPERDSLDQFLRLRLGLNSQWREDLHTEFAYEQRVRWLSNGSVASSGLLPVGGQTHYRIAPLDWQIAKHTNKATYRHEIDRALVDVRQPWGNVVFGRQAVGLGRGALFSAVDMFAAVSPLEVDGEWRRGVDAARVEYRVSDTSSIELLGVFDASWDESALLGRLRGYVGEIDADLILGKRAKDDMVAGVLSSTVQDAEVHVELAFFRTPEAQPDGGFAGNDHHVLRSVVGASYTFDIGSGLTVLGEYHTNGFGVQNAADISKRLLDPTFQNRVLRGDMQVLSRQAAALQLGYACNDSSNAALVVLQAPEDGSGLLTPSLTYDIGASGRIITSVYIPWGDEPRNGQIQSVYGGTPLSLFIQAAIYK